MAARARVPLYVLVVLVDLGLTVWRWTAITAARHAGHADRSYYFDSGRNLARGRGLTSDYVWEFLTLPAHLHHYAADYWQPLPSILFAVPMALTGHHSVTVALSASVIATALIPLPAAVLGYHLSGSHVIAAVTALVMCLVPRLSFWSVQTESVPFYVLFVVAAMAVATAPWSNRRQWFFTALLASAAYLCRNDGALLLVALALPVLRAVVVARKDRVLLLNRLQLLGCYLLGAALLLVPWVVTNLVELHRPVPPTAQLAFLLYFEQLYSLHPQLSLHHVLRGGLGQAIHFRWLVAKTLVGIVDTGIGKVLRWVLLGCAALNLLALRGFARKPAAGVRAGWSVLAGTAVAAFAFEAVVIPIAALGGTWSRSLLAYLPLLVIAALMGLRRVPYGLLVGSVSVLTTVVVLLVDAGNVPALAVRSNNAVGDLVAGWAAPLAATAVDGRVVVMTREPWETTEVTGYPSVMMPNDDICAIAHVGERYGVTALITAKERPKVDGPLLLSRGFGFVGRSGEQEVYRFPRQVTGC